MHTGGRVRDIGPPMQIFKKLVNKNAIKPKIVDPPGSFVMKALNPGILAKSRTTPSPFD
jgi:hypothetical protein